MTLCDTLDDQSHFEARVGTSPKVVDPRTCRFRKALTDGVGTLWGWWGGPHGSTLLTMTLSLSKGQGRNLDVRLSSVEALATTGGLAPRGILSEELISNKISKVMVTLPAFLFGSLGII